MQEKKIANTVATISKIGVIVSFVALCILISALFVKFTPAAHFGLSVIMAMTSITFYTVAVLKTTSGEGGEWTRPSRDWVIAGVWFLCACSQFAVAVDIIKATGS